MGAQKGSRIDVGPAGVPNADLAQRVTGIQPEGASGHPFLRDAGFRSLQRLIVRDVDGSSVVEVLPGELKPNAEYVYSDRRAETFVNTAQREEWLVVANPHIAFRQAPAHQRLYLDPQIDTTEYVELWQGRGFDRFGGYSREELESSMWPWLKEERLATDADDPVFGEFLLDLARHKTQAHLRAGLYARREWARDQVAAGADLATEIRYALNALLGSIGEPRFPIESSDSNP